MARKKYVEIEIPADVVRSGTPAVKIYLDSLDNGATPRMAEMFAMRQPPRCMTDSVLFEGVRGLGDQYNELELKYLLEGAKKHGYTPPPNAMYMPTLARFRGDPEAFITQADGRHYIRKLLEKRGTGGEGAVNVKSREPEEAPKPKYRLAPDIVNRIYQAQCQAKPELREKPVAEVKADIIETHGQKA